MRLAISGIRRTVTLSKGADRGEAKRVVVLDLVDLWIAGECHEVLLRHDHHLLHADQRFPQRLRPLGVDADRLLIDLLGPREVVEAVLLPHHVWRVRGIEHAAEGEDDVVGGHRIAIVEPDALAKLEFDQLRRDFRPRDR
jgi:hypothetical protein